MDEGTTERNQTLPLCVQWSYSRWGCWTADAATITILKWLGFGGDFFFFNIIFLFPPWWRLFRRRLGEKGPGDNFLLNITNKFEGKSQDILTYAIDFWAMFPRQPIDAFCGIQLRSVGRARTKQSREAPPHSGSFVEWTKAKPPNSDNLGHGGGGQRMFRYFGGRLEISNRRPSNCTCWPETISTVSNRYSRPLRYFNVDKLRVSAADTSNIIIHIYHLLSFKF